MSYSKIVKLASGNVQLQDASDNPIKTLQPAANLELLPNGKGVRVLQWQGENTDLLISEIDYTRLDPAADVAFTGDAQDLLTLLSDSFFFELSGSTFPDYPIGSYQSFTETFGTISSNTLGANRIVGKIVNIKKAVEVDEISIRVTGAAAGSAVVGIYKYSDNGTPTGLWTLIEQTDSAIPFNTGVVSTQSVLLTNSAILEAGIYCFGIVCSANFSMYMDTFISANSFIGYASTMGSTSIYLNSMFESFTYNSTMPTTLTSPIISANSLTPLVLARVI